MKIKIKKSMFEEMYIIFFVFVLVFAPPILPKTNLILAAICMMLLLTKYKRNFSRVLYKSGEIHWIITIIVFVGYALTTILINSLVFDDMVQLGHYTALFNRFLVLTVTLVACTTYFICYTEKKAMDVKKYITYVVRAGLIQAIFVYASLLIDPIHDFFLYFLRLFGDSTLYENTWYVTIRSFGFAGTLVDTFGFGMGLIAGIALFYGVFYEKKYILYSLLIALAGTLDARTTLIIYLVSIVIVIIYFILNGKVGFVFKCGIALVLALVILNQVMPILQEVNIDTYNWLNAGIKSVQQLLEGDETSDSMAKLFSEKMWQIPESFQLIFGSGHSLYGARGYAHSDVGYINDLWFVGIVGMLFLYGSIGILIIKGYRRCQSILLKMCMIFFAGATLVFNIKGSAIGYNPGTAVLFSIIFMMNYFGEQKRKDVDSVCCKEAYSVENNEVKD